MPGWLRAARMVLPPTRAQDRMGIFSYFIILARTIKTRIAVELRPEARWRKYFSAECSGQA